MLTDIGPGPKQPFFLAGKENETDGALRTYPCLDERLRGPQNGSRSESVIRSACPKIPGI